MSKSFPIQIGASRGPCHGTLSLPDSGQRGAPCVIISHDLLGDASDFHFPTVKSALTKAGCAVLDFRSASSSAHSYGEGFGETTLRGRSEELAFALTTLFERMFEPGDAIDIRRLGVYGHGFGASVALDRAARDTRVRALALSSPWAEPASGLPQGTDSSWAAGSAARVEGPDGHLYQLPQSFERDWRAHGKRHLDRAAEELTVPVSILSGSRSSAALVSEARRLYFRQPTHARMRSFDCDAAFAGHEERAALHVADFFAAEFGLAKAVSSPSPSPSSSLSSPGPAIANPKRVGERPRPGSEDERSGIPNIL